MSYSTEYFVPNHDPILGIHHKNIAPGIDGDNWQRKAIVADSPEGPMYVYIVPGQIRKLCRKVYCATGYSLDNKQVSWRHPFLTPEEAISWIDRHFNKERP